MDNTARPNENSTKQILFSTSKWKFDEASFPLIKRSWIFGVFLGYFLVFLLAFFFGAGACFDSVFFLAFVVSDLLKTFSMTMVFCVEFFLFMLLCVEMSQWLVFLKTSFLVSGNLCWKVSWFFFHQFCLVAPLKFLLDEWTCKIFMCKSSKRKFRVHE